jgi:ATP synthase F1 delta subunit
MITIARPYAKAIIPLIKDEKDFQSWCDFIIQSDELISYFSKKVAISKVLVGKICDGLELESSKANFLQLLHASKRLDCLPFIKKSLKELWLKANNTMYVKVITSSLLSKEHCDTLENEIKKQFGACLFTYEVDKSILGGMIVKLPHKTIDTSYINKIKNFKQLLKT